MKGQSAIAETQEAFLKYQAVFEASNDAIFWETLEGHILDCNQAACTLFGYTKEELLQLSVADLVPAEIAANLPAVIQEELNDQGIFIKAVNKRKNGEIFPVEVNTRLVTALTEPRVIVYVHDITARERSEKLQAALYNISEVAQMAEDLDQLYSLIHVIIDGVIPAQNFYIALYDPDTDLLSFPYFADEYDDTPPPRKPANGLTEYVLRSGQALLATPETQTQLHRDGIIQSIGADAVDWLGVPLRSQQRTIGVMTIQSYDPQVRYTAADQDFFEFISVQVVMAIERKQAGQALRRSEFRYRQLFETAPVGIFMIAPQGEILEANPAVLQILGSPSLEATRAINTLTFPLLVKVGFSANLRKCFESAQFYVAECTYTSKWGKAIYVRYALTPILDDNGRPILVQALIEDITEAKQAEDALQLRDRLLQGAAKATHLLITEPDLDQAMPAVLQLLGQAAGADRAYVFRNHTDPHSGEVFMSQVFEWISSGISSEIVNPDLQNLPYDILTPNLFEILSQGRPFISSVEKLDPTSQQILKEQGILSILLAPIHVQGNFWGYIGFDDCTLHREWRETEAAILQAAASSLGAAIGRKHAEEEIVSLNLSLQRRAEQLSLLYEAGLTLNHALNVQDQLTALSQIALQALRAENSVFFRYDAVHNEIYYEVGVGRNADADALRHLRVRVGDERGLIGWIAQQRKPFYLPDVSTDERWITINPEFRSALWAPVEHDERLLGLISIVSTRLDAFTTDDQRLLMLFANQVAVALDKLLLFEAERQAREFAETLSQASATLTSTLDSEFILDRLLDQAGRVIPNDAANLRLIKDGQVYVTRWRGYDSFGAENLIHQQMLPLDSYPLFRDILETKQPLVIPDTQKDARWINRPGLEWQRSHVTAPICARDSVIGFLSMYSATAGLYSPIHAKRLGVFANHVAIALENARAFAQMQAWNVELSNAYEATIAGWSRALELRDKETKGHSDRVTHLAVRLARQIGFIEEEITHFRRGVLLHDIGKMVVPDYILLKPEKLDEEEWSVMRQHPAYAYQMLSGIPFLAHAVDIPYCHHENWDGSGYPRRLKGEQIPLSARIFAIVDVWDALTSDRPYHPAWLPEAVCSYIRTQSGIRFDPKIVEEFFKLLDATKSEIER